MVLFNNKMSYLRLLLNVQQRFVSAITSSTNIGVTEMLTISTNAGLLVGIARKLYMRPKAVMLHMYVIPLLHISSAPSITGESTIAS